MTREQLTRFKRNVWQANSVRPVRIYAVLDCARDPLIYDLVARSYREKSCLFAGKLDPELERASPFLLELEQGDSVTDEILLRGSANLPSCANRRWSVPAVSLLRSTRARRLPAELHPG